MRREPVFHEDPEHRGMARTIRDRQWLFADRVAEAGTLWFCWWDKARRHEGKAQSDLWVSGLIDGMEILGWLEAHPDWWVIGEWDDARYAAPVIITDAGRNALANRDAYDLEPVDWGLVEPGHRAIPAALAQPEAGGE